MKQLFYCMALAFMFTACDEGTRENVQNTETNADKSAVIFLERGIMGGMAEIEAARVAKSNSTNPRVLEFADMMIAHHDSLGKQLTKLAKEKDVVVNNTPATASIEMINQLKAKKGAAFDVAYMDQMVKSHEAVVEVFETETRNQSADIQEAAASALPILKEHLQAAQNIRATLK